MGTYQFFPVDRVVYDVPAARAVADAAAAMGARRPFVVTTRSQAAAAATLPAAEVFDRARQHTPLPAVLEALARARALGPDMIVSFGGGSAMDTAKMVVHALARGLRDADAIRAAETRTAGPAVPSVPLVVVPTTLSGSEWTWVAGMTDPEAGRKLIYVAREIAPTLVVLDPAVAAATPVGLWLSTGIKGIDHAVEALCSRNPIPWIRATNLEALRLFAGSLKRTLAAPGDGRARLDGLFATWLTSTGMIRGLYGACHALSWVLGARCGVGHGVASAIMLPAVLRYNAAAIGDAGPAIAAALGMPDATADAAVGGLVQALGLPTRLRDAGIARIALPGLAAGAVGTHYLETNPRPITEAGQILAILEDAW
ncbi:MAG: iron-containing alcohol dehydrogenase [Alphaproteobacteria bacterium]